ncbi:clostripain-related cysteine peptidase [Thermoplasmatota archaeon]
MQKIIGILICLSTILSISTNSIAEINLNIHSSNQDIAKFNENMKWTWMFYDDADFRGADPFNDFANEAFSSENIDIIVLQDPYDGPAKIWYIDQNHNKHLLMDLGEVNMGDSKTLSDFINYSKKNYPADRYLLSFYNHGAGWHGACLDETDKDWLSMDETQTALLATGFIDIICFTAPCLMGSLESIYELKDCTDIYIGSEDLSGYLAWEYAIDDICSFLDENPDMSNIEIGANIISILKENQKFVGSIFFITISAIQTDLIDGLVENVDRLAINMIETMNSNPYTITKIGVILKLTKSYGTTLRFRNTETIDLYDFSKKCIQIFSSDSMIKSNAEAVIDSIDKVVIGNIRGLRQLRSYGLTIYFPNKFYDNDYIETLDFTNMTHWDELIISYFRGKTNIDQFQTDSRGGATVCGEWLWAQSFKTSAKTLDKVQIKIVQNGLIFSDVKISIRNNLYGEDLTSYSKPFYFIPRGNNVRWIEFDFDDITVIPGNIYYIVCYTDRGDQKNFYNWRTSLNDVYKSGDAWIGWNKGTNWEIYENPLINNSRFDFCFKTYSK